MKQKLLLTLGIILLLIMGLVASPARAENPGLPSSQAMAAKNPTLRSVMDALIALQNSVNNLQSFQENMPSAWYQILPSDQRFLLVMDDKAVLDRETGLIWEKSPLHPCLENYCIPEAGTRSWEYARWHCMPLTVGGRMGWRLPTIEELASLVDPNNPSGVTPYLPPGHPFDNVQRSWYWSATSHESALLNFRVIDFRDGTVNAADMDNAGGSVWCVWGGHGNPLVFWGNLSWDGWVNGVGPFPGPWGPDSW